MGGVGSEQLGLGLGSVPTLTPPPPLRPCPRPRPHPHLCPRPHPRPPSPLPPPAPPPQFKHCNMPAHLEKMLQRVHVMSRGPKAEVLEVVTFVVAPLRVLVVGVILLEELLISCVL
jgi:hypothetical protein